MTADIIRFAGDVNVDKISLISFNGTEYSIKNQLISIQIFEDLFSPFITGVLTFKDSLDLINALPMIGQEILDIHIYTPTLKDKKGEIKQQFAVFNLLNREFVAEKNAVYEVQFISKEALVDSNIKLSKGYQGRVSDIVLDIASDELVKFTDAKKIIIENTSNSTKYVSNYWSPVKNFKYLSDFAVNESGSPSYIFFENRDGFNFGSLETLARHQIITQEFNYDSSTQEVNPTGSSNRDINRDFSRIIEYSLKTGFNSLTRSSSGMIASGAFGYDITTKRFSVKTFDYFSNFNNRKHLNKYPLVTNTFPSYFTSRLMFVPKPYENFTGFGANTSFDKIQRRVSEVLQAEDFKIEIQAPGRLDYTVGQVVKIKSFQIAPLKKEESNPEVIDSIFSGRYLVTAINHFITRESHQCSIELSKDSYISAFRKRGQA